MKNNTVKSIAEALTQEGKEIVVNGKVYIYQPPTIATLAMVSKELDNIQEVNLSTQNLVFETLAIGESFLSIANAVATMLLGAKGINKRVLGFPIGKYTFNKLSKSISETIPPSEVLKLLMKLLEGLQIADFFILITSLNEVAVIRRTKKEMTASGQ